MLLYQIFKDADALDRFRLGPGGFDPKYLRTGEAKELVEYARSVWEECRPKEQEIWEGGVFVLKEPGRTKTAIVEWIKDYFQKYAPGASAVVGISGGKDSSVTAADPVILDKIDRLHQRNLHKLQPIPHCSHL